jgi:hypothetical protein
MSFQPSTTTKYVYIPNLVGRQMLRVQILSCEDSTEEGSDMMPTLETNILPGLTFEFALSRSASPAPSLESVDQEE